MPEVASSIVPAPPSSRPASTSGRPQRSFIASFPPKAAPASSDADSSDSPALHPAVVSFAPDSHDLSSVHVLSSPRVEREQEFDDDNRSPSRGHAESDASEDSQSSGVGTNLILHGRELFECLENSPSHHNGNSNSNTLDGDHCVLSVRKLLREFEKIGLRPTDPRLKKVYERLHEYHGEILDFPNFRKIIQPAAQLLERALSHQLAIPNFRAFIMELERMQRSVQENYEKEWHLSMGGTGTPDAPLLPRQPSPTPSQLQSPQFLINFRPIPTAVPQRPALVPAHIIPALASLPDIIANEFSFGFCSIDGQQHTTNVDRNVTLQALAKSILYLTALEEHGEEYVHNFVGREPSGREFNSLNLSHENIPENPLVDSGAIMCTSLIQSELSHAQRYQYIFNVFKQCTASGADDTPDLVSTTPSEASVPGLSFNNSVYLSMKNCSDRSWCIGYMMQERGAFQTGKDRKEKRYQRQWDREEGIKNSLELFLQACCIEMNLLNIACIGATLANGGVNPLTGKRIFQAAHVKSCLSLMLSCGMNVYSGQWANLIGLPAQSSVNGLILMVIPNVGSLCLFSPLLQPQHKITAKGLEFSKLFIKRMGFHHLKIHSSVDEGQGPYTTPSSSPSAAIHHRVGEQVEAAVKICYYCSKGDLNGLVALHSRGVDLNCSDYDGRTGLHLAASNGYYVLVKYLLAHGCDCNPVDRTNGTPLDDAIRGNHTQIIAYIKSNGGKTGKELLNNNGNGNASPSPPHHHHSHSRDPDDEDQEQEQED